MYCPQELPPSLSPSSLPLLYQRCPAASALAAPAALFVPRTATRPHSAELSCGYESVHGYTCGLWLFPLVLQGDRYCTVDDE